MIKTVFEFHCEVYNHALTRAISAVNLWELRVKQGDLQDTKDFREARKIVNAIQSLHPNVAKVRAEELTEELDAVFDNAFGAFAQAFGTMHAISVIR